MGMIEYKKNNLQEIKVNNKKVFLMIKNKIKSIRELREGIMELANSLIQKEEYEAYLVLIDPKITISRMRDEWKKIKRIVRQGIVRRLAIIKYKDGQYNIIGDNNNQKIEKILNQIDISEKEPEGIKIPNPNYYYELFKILIYQKLKKLGPVTSLRLSEIAGCSYPTIAKAKKRLKSILIENSNKKIELKSFPYKEWEKLLVIADQVRATMWFVDKSGKPRKPEYLIRRLQKLNLPNIAIGGVFGAKHYFPDINIIGLPRLNLSICFPTEDVDLGFINRLDPALSKVDSGREAANLVIHFIRRIEPFFVEDNNGINIADPVECLMDLHEMRLELQAKEFIKSFIK